MTIDHECEQHYLTEHVWCPNPGRVLYKAHQDAGVTIHFHLCGDCAIKAAGVAFRQQMALYDAPATHP